MLGWSIPMSANGPEDLAGLGVNIVCAAINKFCCRVVELSWLDLLEFAQVDDLAFWYLFIRTDWNKLEISTIVGRGYQVVELFIGVICNILVIRFHTRGSLHVVVEIPGSVREHFRLRLSDNLLFINAATTLLLIGGRLLCLRDVVLIAICFAFICYVVICITFI